MKDKNNERKKLYLESFDILFIMILCFATLLSAMLLKSEAGVVMDYSINMTTLAITIIGLITYIIYVVRESDKGLKTLINQLYGKEKNIVNRNNLSIDQVKRKGQNG